MLLSRPNVIDPLLAVSNPVSRPHPTIGQLKHVKGLLYGAPVSAMNACCRNSHSSHVKPLHSCGFRLWPQARVSSNFVHSTLVVTGNLPPLMADCDSTNGSKRNLAPTSLLRRFLLSSSFRNAIFVHVERFSAGEPRLPLPFELPLLYANDWCHWWGEGGKQS